jgi:hypothetical protein
MGLFKRLKKIISPPLSNPDWKEIEFFDLRWKDRIKEMASHIRPGEVVLDLGCGQCWLKEFLPENCHYIPCDYVSRSEDTIVCDFNAGQFPEEKVDVCFISGCLEYVQDPGWFVGKVSAFSNRCIIAYCITRPEDDLKKRREKAWKNDFSTEDLVSLFSNHGFELKHRGGKYMSSYIFVFEKPTSTS